MKRIFSILLLLLCTFSFAGEIEMRECIEQWNLRQIGVRETGYNSGKNIETYIKACGFKPTSQISYCACYVKTGMDYCGVIGLPNCPAMAACWFNLNKTIYRRSEVGGALNWKVGDVFSLYNDSEKRISHMGYIMYVNADRGYIISGESNTYDSGNIALPGEGTHARKRNIKQIHMVADYISTSSGTNNVKVIYHIVQKKETLYRISNSYNVTIDDLLSWNPDIADEIIYLGQKIIIKK